ncbi:hypothetical protein [Chryseobacterium indologenes]|uniref:hypothetical protein n=1 Tax=Chryseobacterium indologenes TaxID=253 RepID=UPI0030184D21
MKTKLIILAAVAAAIIYSCSNDRDDEARQEAIEKVKNSNQNFKLNKSGMQAREGEAQSTSDTIKVRGLNGTFSDDPDTGINPDDPEIVPPGDVKPPKGGK